MNDRRFELRVRRADQTDILWEDQAGERHRDPAYLTDISASGAAVRAQSAVPFGTAVSIAYQNQTLTGKVRQCVRREAGYLLGIEFEPGHRWSLRQ
jgi:hypothetical protein